MGKWALKARSSATGKRMLQEFLLTLDSGTRKAVLREMRKGLADLNLMPGAEW